MQRILTEASFLALQRKEEMKEGREGETWQGDRNIHGVKSDILNTNFRISKKMFQQNEKKNLAIPERPHWPPW